MGYTREEILAKCKEAIEDVETFYTQKFVNYTGKTTDTKEFYTEVVAEFVLGNIEKFKSIKPINRELKYNQGHTGEHNEKSNRVEEIDAMNMYKQCHDFSESAESHHTIGAVGEIIDYQIPLKSCKKDKAGKIDLLSINEEAVYVLELKKEDSKETLLRCVLEGYTYLKLVDKEKIYNEYSDINNKSLPLRTAPLVYENGHQWEEYNEIKDDKRSNLKALMEKLSDDSKPITPFFINEKYNTIQ